MMAADVHPPHLIDYLPLVRGRLRADEPLARFTWFRVGGPAEVLFEPADQDDLSEFLKHCPKDIDITVLGGTSNVLVRDGGVPGVVIRLGKGFNDISVDGTVITAGAAAADMHVARKAADAGIGGLSFLIGIPGVVGGAVAMNAGAYGRELKDAFVECTVMDRQGALHTLTADDLDFAYRKATLPVGAIIVQVRFAGEKAVRDELHAEMSRIQSQREETQPVRTRTGGSTFANPPGHKAWELIDAVGGRGLKMGGAQVSEQHCNFLINTGDATAADLERLGEELRRRVKAERGVDLHWEVRRIGVPISNELGEVSS